MSHRVVFGGFVVSRICGSSAVPGTQQIRIQLQELCRYSRALNHSTNSSFEVCLGPASSSFQHCDICIPLPPRPPQGHRTQPDAPRHWRGGIASPQGTAFSLGTTSPWALHPHAEYHITSCQEFHPSPRYCILLVPHPPTWVPRPVGWNCPSRCVGMEG